MKVLTIKQPWASLIMLGYKKFEFRTWKTNYRGELLIHAGKETDKEALRRLDKYIPKELPTGKIIGKVKIVDCQEVDSQLRCKLIRENPDIYKNTEIGIYAWKIEDVVSVENPIEINGKLGFWNYELD